MDMDMDMGMEIELGWVGLKTEGQVEIEIEISRTRQSGSAQGTVVAGVRRQCTHGVRVRGIYEAAHGYVATGQSRKTVSKYRVCIRWMCLKKRNWSFLSGWVEL